MSTAVGKTVFVLSYPSLSLKARSVSCSRLQYDGQQLASHSNVLLTASACAKHTSTADHHESERSTQAGAKSTVKEWMQHLIHLDLQAVARALSPLQLDLPRFIPQYKADWGLWLKTPAARKKLKEGEGEERHETLTVVEVKKDAINKKALVPGLGIADVQRVVRPSEELSEPTDPFQSEQHNFADAMTNMHESVGRFQLEQLAVKEILSTELEILSSKPALKKDSMTAAPTLVVTQDRVTPGSQSLVSQAAVTATYAIDATTTIVKQIASYLPSYGTPTKKPEEVVKPDKARLPQVVKKDDSLVKKVAPPAGRTLVAKGSIDRRTRALVVSLREAKTSISQTVRLEELCRHLLQYPEAGNVAVKDKVIPCLLRLRSSKDVAMQEIASETLALVGYIDPTRGNGVRILALDGGGTKGLIAIEIMKKLEEITHRRIHELFDYVCGVSTGALIAAMAAAYRVPLSETEQVYKEFSAQMFARNRFVGAGKLFMSHAYYDTQLWERILLENIGEKTFLETTQDPLCPKLSAVSTLMNVSRVQNFVFRNYNLPPGRQSHYTGSITHQLWEAIRASSAAPGYYEEFQLGDHVHQDGGLLTNNPAAIAIHECQLLWPKESLQCVVSIGTGRHETIQELEPVSKSSLKAKVAKVIQSATDTEAVHTVLHDLLKPSTYFRFNPYMSEDFILDEIREAKWEQMKQDTEMYCRKNQLQLEMAALRLLQPRPTYKKALDWLKLQLALRGR